MRRARKWERSFARLRRPVIMGTPVSKEGPLAAALLASGIGSAALGVSTVLAKMTGLLSRMMTLYRPVGPMSGMTAYPVLLWLVAWVVLHFRWRDKEKSFSKVVSLTIMLVLVGLIGTFPPLYEYFSK